MPLAGDSSGWRQLMPAVLHVEACYLALSHASRRQVLAGACMVHDRCMHGTSMCMAADQRFAEAESSWMTGGMHTALCRMPACL